MYIRQCSVYVSVPCIYVNLKCIYVSPKCLGLLLPIIFINLWRILKSPFSPATYDSQSFTPSLERKVHLTACHRDCALLLNI